MWDPFVNTSPTPPTFTGSHAKTLNAGSEVNLQTGSDAHWFLGTMSTVYNNPPAGVTCPVAVGNSQETYMDPSLPLGPDANARQCPTDLDMAAFQDMHWVVVPEPRTYVLLTGLFTLILAFYKRDSLRE